MRLQRAIYMLMISALFSGVLGGVASCGKLQDGQTADSFRSNFRLTFSVPVGTKASHTAEFGDNDNTEGSDNSLNINDIEVYFFDLNGTFVSSVTDFSDIRLNLASSGSYNPHYHLYDAQLHVNGISGGEQYRVVVLANKRSSYSSSLPFCVPYADNWLETGVGATDEEKLYSTLEFNYSSTGIRGLEQYMNMNFAKDDMGYVPMWGFAQITAQTVIGEGNTMPANIPSSGNIDLLRALAKVRVEIAPELMAVVKPTVFDKETRSGGIRLCNPVKTGFMTPSYDKVRDMQSTPDILNRDRQGGNPGNGYSDEWINRGNSAEAGSEAVYPLFGNNGVYYTYLPEAYMGQAWMELEFEWKDPGFSSPVRHGYHLLFADYAEARKHFNISAGIALTHDQLKEFEFPVMRNHYYIYTVTRLNPLELKFEVCEWKEKSTSISFN